MAFEDYTQKDYTDIIYNKVDIDNKLLEEADRVNTALANKIDEISISAPSGVASLGSTGKHQPIEIPFASLAEALDSTNAVSVLNPLRVHNLISHLSVLKDTIGQSNGVAPLDANGKVPDVNLPATPISHVYVRDTLQDMYNLVIQGYIVNVGDRCIVTTEAVPHHNAEYVANIPNPTDSSGWTKLPSLDAVQSVNGQTGNVNISSIAESQANALAITDLSVAVDTVEANLITTNTNLDITNTNVTANLDAINDLDVRVTQNETDITAITPLTTRVADLEAEDIVINNKVNSFGLLTGLTDAQYSVSPTPQAILNYTSGPVGGVFTSNLTDGTLLTSLTGYYRVSFIGDISFASSSQTRSISLELVNFTDNEVEAVSTMNIPRDAVVDSKSLTAVLSLTEGKEYGLRVSSSVGMVVTFNMINLSMELVGV